MSGDRPGFLPIDGSYGEGGGQLVRTALALSALTGVAMHISGIRAGRARPGLRAQHVAAVRAVADICGAHVEGVELGSRTLSFEPTARPQSGRYRWEIGTAGAVSLLFQTVLWPLALAPGTSDVTLVGGTHVEWSPPVDYILQVYLPLVAGLLVRQGDGRSIVSLGGADSGRPKARTRSVRHPGPDRGDMSCAGNHLGTISGLVSLSIEQWGWYPRGGGVIHATISGGVRLRALRLTDRGSLRSVSVLSAASNLPAHIRQRQAGHADVLLRKGGIRPQIEILAAPSPGKGTAVFVLAEYQHGRAGFTSYGRIRKPAERVAEQACKAFFRYHKRGQPVDEHLADQLLLPVALAHRPTDGDAGFTEYAVESVTEHLVTHAWVIKQFLEDVCIEIDGDVGKTGTVKVGSRTAFSTK